MVEVEDASRVPTNSKKTVCREGKDNRSYSWEGDGSSLKLVEKYLH